METDDYTVPHSAIVMSDEDIALGKALQRFLAGRRAPIYLREVAETWLMRTQ